MNSFRKSKGIVIELTALLDVILIMLFWMMMNLSENNKEIIESTKMEIADAKEQVEIEKQNAQSEIDRILEDANKQIAQAEEKYENSDSLAHQNQQALDGYEQGLLVTLSLKNEGQEEVLYITQNNSEISSHSLNDNNISMEIIDALEELEIQKDDTVLCAFVYDGDMVLYRDVVKVENAVDGVRDVYKNFYCAYINTGV